MIETYNFKVVGFYQIIIVAFNHKNQFIKQLLPYQTILTKWLIGLTLVWSVFLFSGYVDNDFLTLPSISKTELVEFQSPNSILAISQYYIGRLTSQKQPSFFLFYPKAALITYNQLQQVQFNVLKKKGYAYSFSFVDLLIHIIPTNSTDLPLSFC